VIEVGRWIRGLTGLIAGEVGASGRRGGGKGRGLVGLEAGLQGVVDREVYGLVGALAEG